MARTKSRKAQTSWTVAKYKRVRKGAVTEGANIFPAHTLVILKFYAAAQSNTLN